MRGFMVVGIACSLALLGCGKAAEVVTEEIAEQALKSEGVENPQIDIKSDGSGGMSFNVSTPEGKFSLQAGEDAAMPANFPKDVPLPADLKLGMSNAMGNGMIMIMGTTAGKADAVAADLKKKALAQGWTESATMNIPGQGAMLTFTKEDRGLNYTVGMDSGQTSVTVSVGSK